MKSLELFAGIGGISLAAEWAGVETVAFCEREPFCQKVLKKNWPDIPIFDDIRTLNKQALEERGINVGTIELISGGFPCQPFSIAGNRKGKEDDRDLWPEMFRVIKELKPRWIVGENVANFANMELDRTLFDLESIGYRWRAFILPALAIGANHRRDRTFVVAYSDSIGDNTEKKCRVDREWKKEMQERKESQFGSSDNINALLCDSDSKSELQTDKESNSIGKEWETWEGIARKYRGTPSRTHWEADQPTVCRMDDGVSNGLDKSRLKALGNAVVPQQIYPIFEAIMKLEVEQ